ncbi:hypothetical protein FRC12_015028 [Ceratobasidium sp. 428]|nr:hypothetical protein FRC12_015028 [Ceratobasidium sp. 428]
MRDIIEKRKILSLYVPAPENLSNAFTKALPAPQFRYLMATVLGDQPFDDEDDYLWNCTVHFA